MLRIDPSQCLVRPKLFDSHIFVAIDDSVASSTVISDVPITESLAMTDNSIIGYYHDP